MLADTRETEPASSPRWWACLHLRLERLVYYVADCHAWDERYQKCLTSVAFLSLLALGRKPACSRTADCERAVARRAGLHHRYAPFRYLDGGTTAPSVRSLLGAARPTLRLRTGQPGRVLGAQEFPCDQRTDPGNFRGRVGPSSLTGLGLVRGRTVASLEI